MIAIKFKGSLIKSLRGKDSRDTFVKMIYSNTGGELNISIQRLQRLEDDIESATINTTELGLLCKATKKTPNYYYGLK